MRKVNKPGCINPDQKEYEVKEIEAGLTCVTDYAAELEAQNAALRGAIRKREKAAEELAKVQK